MTDTTSKTGTSSLGAPAGAPSEEVVARPTRRQFSAAEKLRLLEAAEAGTPSERSALLRREGLYTSHLALWRQQRAAGTLAGQKRGPKVDPQAQELAQLMRENAQLQARLQRAELIIDAQKKLFELLEQLPPDGAEHP
jgi:transposase-like protein